MTAASGPIAIFGGTGTVGTELLRLALTSGHRVRALVRRPAALGNVADELDVVIGDVRDPNAVAATVAGCVAVLSTLGAGRGDDPATRRVGTANIVDAMRAEGIRRLIAMAGFHVRLPGDPGNLGQKLIIPLLKLTPGVDLDDTEGFARTVIRDRDQARANDRRVRTWRTPSRPRG